MAFPRTALLWLLLCLPFAAAFAADDVMGPAQGEATTLDVFVRAGCPRCREAKVFLDDLQRRYPQLRIVYHDVGESSSALGELERRSHAAGLHPASVPTFAVGGRLLVGFAGVAESGPALIALLSGNGAGASQNTVDTVLFGTLSASQMGLPLFTLALGLLDGFNPCATWVLLFLLSLLVHLQDRWRMALMAGTFVLVSGAVYYAFMAAWLNVFLIIGWSDALRWVLGGLAAVIGAVNIKDFFAFGRGPSLSIPASAKPGIYARMRAIVTAESVPPSLLAVAVLAVVVNTVELLCTAGFPAVYTAVLTQQQLDAWLHYGYLGLYIAGYIADDSLMVAVAIITLSNRRLTQRAGRWLKLVSGAVMVGLAAILVLRPAWLF